MPPARSDLRVLVGAGVAALLAGLLVAALLLAATSRNRGPRHYKPFAAGPADQLRRQLADGGPFFVADPFGGNRNVLFALEHDNLVALWANRPGKGDCAVRWRGSINNFVDCRDHRLRSEDLARFETRVGTVGNEKGVLLVDLRHRDPPPAQRSSSDSSSTSARSASRPSTGASRIPGSVFSSAVTST